MSVPTRRPAELTSVRHGFFRLKIDGLLDFSNSVEHGLKRDLHRFKKWAKQEAQQSPDNTEFLESLADQYQHMRTEFPLMLRSSLLVMLCASFEDHLHAQCCSLQRWRELRLAPTDVAGKGIERSRLYLKKVVGVDFPDTDTSWAMVVLLRDVRNAIVHAGGKASAKLISRFKGHRFVSADATGHIQLARAAVNELSKAVLAFEGLLHSSIQAVVSGDQ